MKCLAGGLTLDTHCVGFCIDCAELIYSDGVPSDNTVKHDIREFKYCPDCGELNEENIK